MTQQPYSIRLFIFFSISCLFAFSCNSTHPDSHTTGSVKEEKYGKFAFTERSYSFGKIHDGDTAVHIFHYTNVGDAPLLIHDISTGCGCTIVEWPKNATPVNDIGTIKVQFSKRHDPGYHTKAIIIKANTQETYTVLHIEAIISG